MKEKHSHYQFEITLSIVGQCHDGWVYEIYNDAMYGGNIESDEWFDSEQEARCAAIEHINRLEDGPDEPDYDAPTAQEMYQRAYEDKQRAKGRMR